MLVCVLSSDRSSDLFYVIAERWRRFSFSLREKRALRAVKRRRRRVIKREVYTFPSIFVFQCRRRGHSPIAPDEVKIALEWDSLFLFLQSESWGRGWRNSGVEVRALTRGFARKIIVQVETEEKAGGVVFCSVAICVSYSSKCSWLRLMAGLSFILRR